MQVRKYMIIDMHGETTNAQTKLTGFILSGT